MGAVELMMEEGRWWGSGQITNGERCAARDSIPPSSPILLGLPLPLRMCYHNHPAKTLSALPPRLCIIVAASSSLTAPLEYSKKRTELYPHGL